MWHRPCSAEGVGVSRFEDLRVWQAAIEQGNKVSALTNRPRLERDVELSRQLNSATLSVSSNISEGFLRHRDREFLQFLRIAAGSNGEVRSCLHAAHGRGYIDKAEAEPLIEESNVIGRMIRRLQQTLDPGREPRTDRRPSPREGQEPRPKDSPRPRDSPRTKT